MYYSFCEGLASFIIALVARFSIKICFLTQLLADQCCKHKKMRSSHHALAAFLICSFWSNSYINEGRTVGFIITTIHQLLMENLFFNLFVWFKVLFVSFIKAHFLKCKMDP